VLQCVAVCQHEEQYEDSSYQYLCPICCSVLQCVAVCCSVLQCGVVCQYEEQYEDSSYQYPCRIFGMHIERINMNRFPSFKSMPNIRNRLRVEKSLSHA